jgi:hypothetical protein
MRHDTDHAYDSFVVRLWREVATGRLLRAEVEHVQGGTVAAGRGVAPEWVLDCLRARLGNHRLADGAAPEPTGPSLAVGAAAGGDPGADRGADRGANPEDG